MIQLADLATWLADAALQLALAALRVADLHVLPAGVTGNTVARGVAFGVDMALTTLAIAATLRLSVTEHPVADFTAVAVLHDWLAEATLDTVVSFAAEEQLDEAFV